MVSPSTSVAITIQATSSISSSDQVLCNTQSIEQYPSLQDTLDFSSLTTNFVAPYTILKVGEMEYNCVASMINAAFVQIESGEATSSILSKD